MRRSEHEDPIKVRAESSRFRSNLALSYSQRMRIEWLVCESGLKTMRNNRIEPHRCVLDRIGMREQKREEDQYHVEQ